jgi:hypothetical protein
VRAVLAEAGGTVEGDAFLRECCTCDCCVSAEGVALCVTRVVGFCCFGCRLHRFFYAIAERIIFIENLDVFDAILNMRDFILDIPRNLASLRRGLLRGFLFGHKHNY